MSGMSLWAIDQTIAQLVSLREDPDLTEEEQAAIDYQLSEWIQQEVSKVDRCRSFIRYCEHMAEAAKTQAADYRNMCAIWQGRADRVSLMVQTVMESRGEKKLDGVSGSFAAKVNGGMRKLEPINEALLPDEYRQYRMTLAAPAWRALQAILVGSQATLAPAILRAMLSTVKAEVNTAAVRAALEAGKEVPGARLADRGNHLEVK
jgi:hypothetical protein